MPAGQLYINGVDAYTTYGVSLSDGALNALMAPPPNKEYITNESRLEHGTRYTVVAPKMAARDVTLEIHMRAQDEPTFLQRYDALCEVLAASSIVLRTSFRPNVYFRMRYISCTQFTQFRFGLAKFSLKLVEPNPSDRAGDIAPNQEETTS